MRKRLVRAALVLALVTPPFASATRPIPTDDAAAETQDPVWSLVPPPEPRIGHSLVHDPVRNRVILFGGNIMGEVWALSLGASPRWRQILTEGTPQGTRSRHTAIYDPVGDRMIVYGGNDNTSNYPVGSIWALPLSGEPVWSEISPAGVPPEERENHCAVYDAAAHRMLVLGGTGSSGDLPDSWALSLDPTPAWTQIPAVGDGPRGAITGCFVDSARNRVIAIPAQFELYRIYQLSLSDPPAWSDLSTTTPGPAALRDYSLTYDPSGDRAIVFGGEYGGFRDQTWELSFSAGNEWRQMEPSGPAPPPQSRHRAVVDPAGARMVIFGGQTSDGRHNDVRALSLHSPPAWSVLVPEDLPPSARSWASAVHDANHDRALVFGGFSGDSWCCDDTWSFRAGDTGDWIELLAGGSLPPLRYQHTAIYDPLRDRMIVHGGRAGPALSDVWELSLTGDPVWTELSPQGTPAAARYGHSAIYDPPRDRMIVFAGVNGSTFGDDNEVWALALSGTPAWTRILTQGPLPYPRDFHTAIYDPAGDRMIVFGGQYGILLNDVWALSLGDTPTWTDLSPASTAPAPAARKEHSAVYDPDRQRMIILGGLGMNNVLLDDVWAFSLAAPEGWTRLSTRGFPPGPMSRHQAVYDPSRHRMGVFMESQREIQTWLRTWQLSFGQEAAPDPDCSQATALPSRLWPPDHRLVPVTIQGVTAPDPGPLTITVTDVTQDEAPDDRGDGGASPDAVILDGAVQVRAERSATGNGRVYVVGFRASTEGGGSCQGSVVVCVPHNRDGNEWSTGDCEDDGLRFSSR